MSYIPADEGWLYLDAIKDMAAREVLGWSMADHLSAPSYALLLWS